MADNGANRDYEVEVVLLVTAPSIAEARNALHRSGVWPGAMVGETTILDTTVYAHEEDE